jgi:rare lipoprotein A
VNEDEELTTRTIAFLSALACALAIAPSAVAQPADGQLVTRPGALLGHVTNFRGTLGAGRTVVLQRQQPDGSWKQVARTQTGSTGAFVARWRADALGPATVRAVTAGAQGAASPLTAQLTVYRPARATWFGPGLYGKKTACGQVLSHALMGVAHRTLPCGTPVAIYFAGRTITVPVVDRGPFANGAHYDLTSAAANAVGMTQTSTIGVIPQRGQTMDPPPDPSAPAGDSTTGGTAF